jgi:hypothetical protein
MGDYLVSNIEYPATQYEPTTPEENGVYHEDREVTVSSPTPGSQMFRTYNAQFLPEADPPSWSFNNPDLPAYATVQNPDGSIHYYALEAGSPPTWAGSGNNAVFNAVDYGLVQGAGQSPATRAANVAAIQSAINAAIARIPAKPNGGGTVVIPAGIYELGGTLAPALAATIQIENVTGGLTIRGESAGTTLIQYGTPPSGTGTSTAADIFDVSSSGNPGQVGIRFREITFQYGQGLILPSAGAFAINCMAGSADVTADQCGFFDCPGAFSAAGGSSGGLECGLMHCSVLLGPVTYTGTTQVVLSGPEAFVESCEFFTGAGPQGCTAIQVGNGAEGCRIEGCHISDFSNAIAVVDGAHLIKISKCKVDALAGLTIAPKNAGGEIYGVFVTACSFGMIEKNTSTSPSWGIKIDTAGGVNTKVEGICIDNCIAYGYVDAGIQINQGQSISIIGGKYSSNGQDPSSTALGAGIAITGECADVRIVGADCSGVFDFWPTVQASPGSPAVTQPYGISVVSGVTAVCVADCNLMNNETAALYVPTAGTDLRVNNCAGYNDQRTPLNDELAPESEVGAFTCTTPYYGPSVVTFSNPSNLEVYASGVTNFMSFGSLYLSHASDLISFSGQPSSSFAWIGK